MQFIAKGLLTAVEQKDHFIPEGAEVRIIQNTDEIRYMILPASPKTLSKQELAMAAGGDAGSTPVIVSLQSVVSSSVTQVVENVQTSIVTGPGCVEPTVSVVAIGISVLV